MAEATVLKELELAKFALRKPVTPHIEEPDYLLAEREDREVTKVPKVAATA